MRKIASKKKINPYFTKFVKSARKIFVAVLQSDYIKSEKLIVFGIYVTVILQKVQTY